ncbi:DUF1643 domain-containing protein [Microbacterium sp. NRRL B-14842]|uniref:DUF1643 domain-containing protein n=1 Tax=Microbacterium sp. NRRL B-14842 TaxID=3162881 RepID=UPI003D28CF28
MCVGVNPSTAAPGDPDRTVSKVMGFAARNGFDSWVMRTSTRRDPIDPKGNAPGARPQLQADKRATHRRSHRRNASSRSSPRGAS